MAQDPENEGPQDENSFDLSHGSDLVTMYASQGVDAEMEADVIHGILDSNGVPSLVARATGYPILGFEVRVPLARLEEARRLVAEAQAAGPDAAVEAEAAGEEGR